MKMNPRQIAKLCKHLRDAGAIHVQVAPDGTVQATFPPPNQFWVNPPWWYQTQPNWITPGWQITYPQFPNTFKFTDGTTSIGSVTTSYTNAEAIEGSDSPVFYGFNQVVEGDHMVGQTLTISPEN